MDRDSAFEAAWDRHNTASPLAGPSDDFTAGWQAALAYVRGEGEPAGHPFAPGVEFYPLGRCYVWRRESTKEWVLELNGEINDCFFTSRHTQPLSVKPEDVPGLPSLYEGQTEPDGPSPAIESSGSPASIEQE